MKALLQIKCAIHNILVRYTISIFSISKSVFNLIEHNSLMLSYYTPFLINNFYLKFLQLNETHFKVVRIHNSVNKLF